MGGENLPIGKGFVALILALKFLTTFNMFVRSPPSVLSKLANTAPGTGHTTRVTTPLRNGCLFYVGPTLRPFSSTSFQGSLGTFISNRARILSSTKLPRVALSIYRASCPLLYCTATLYRHLATTKTSIALGRCDRAVLHSHTVGKQCRLLLISRGALSTATLPSTSVLLLSTRRVRSPSYRG